MPVLLSLLPIHSLPHSLTRARSPVPDGWGEGVCVQSEERRVPKQWSKSKCLQAAAAAAVATAAVPAASSSATAAVGPQLLVSAAAWTSALHPPRAPRAAAAAPCGKQSLVPPHPRGNQLGHRRTLVPVQLPVRTWNNPLLAVPSGAIARHSVLLPSLAVAGRRSRVCAGPGKGQGRGNNGGAAAIAVGGGGVGKGPPRGEAAVRSRKSTSSPRALLGPFLMQSTSNI